MKVRIDPTLIYRIPQFSINDDLKESWESLKSSIAISSTEFYNIIKDVETKDLDYLPGQTAHTIWKYFNRAKYRATPYGSFAGFGLFDLGSVEQGNKLIVDNKQQLHCFTDWSCKKDINQSFTEIMRMDATLFANSSYYKVGDQIRFITDNGGQFALSETDLDEQIMSVLGLCANPIKISELKKALQSILTEQEIEEKIENLLSVQLLFSSNHPNIIGQDYFERIGYANSSASKQYIIAERPYVNGGLDPGVLRHVPLLVEKLSGLASTDKQSPLKDFITRFSRKFEQREVPLMVALDPELGVGYDELEQADLNDEFIGSLIKKSTSNNSAVLTSEVLKEIIRGLDQRPGCIDLEQLKLPEPNRAVALPNTFGLICSVVDDQVFIEHLGGVTANALLGRFALASKSMHTVCKQMASLEQEANPDVLFFDIGYISETSVDNVNRRRCVYDLQLNILTYDTSEDPLTLDDLLLSVHGGKLVLRSQRLDRRLIPRLASAYNYTRSDLSVFRLLCDLQAQELQSSLSIDLKAVIPDLDYYPCLKFRNIALSHRCWRLRYESGFSDTAHLIAHLKKIEVSQFVRTGMADQTLTFDTSKEVDLNILTKMLQKQRSLYVEEMLLPQNSVVQDSGGKPYLGQYIINLTHEKKIYNGVRGYNKPDQAQLPNIFPPGSEWLYFEIFCHPYRSDALLTDKIESYLKDNRKLIRSWFFIRYNEGGNHLRLRLRIKEPQSAVLLVSGLSCVLERELEDGIISDLNIRTYKREVERYGAANIERVEKHFFKDSQYVLNMLQAMVPAMQKYRWCIRLISAVEDSGIFEPEVFHKVIRKISSAFKEEHQFGTEAFKKLNEHYQLYQKTAEMALTASIQASFDGLRHSLIETLDKCNELDRGRLFNDLMHMHINRLFNSEQRVHEAAVYYFFEKDTLQKQGKARKAIA